MTNPPSLPMLVTNRWREAVAKNDMATWRSLLVLLDVEMLAATEYDEDGLETAALSGIMQAATARYMSMMPRMTA